MADLSIEVNGLRFPNPFLIGSGPPSTNARVIARAFDLGWGGAVAKTFSLDSKKVVNVRPRYGTMKLEGAAASGKADTIGFENIELISDRPIEDWTRDFEQLKKDYPDNILIASIMEEYARERWQEITRVVQDAGADAIELNLSCPHGHTEHGMGAAMGQSPEVTREVCAWVKEVATVPIWAKMTPNITHISEPGAAAVEGGADGLAAINTILSIIGINLDTLRPIPTVEGHSCPGGYSGQAIHPIALRMVWELAEALPDVPISGIGGVTAAKHAIQFLLLGASTVQVCTGVMLQGHEMIAGLIEGLEEFMEKQEFETVQELVGKSRQYITTHMKLVELMGRTTEELVNLDKRWGEAAIEDQTEELTSAG